MKKFIQQLAIFVGMYLLYKAILFSSVLLLKKQPLHNDLGKNGNNQTIILGSSNVHFSYNYQTLNTDSNTHVRSCWVPASYGVALNLYKLQQIAKKDSRVLIEFPYHWYLIDQMAPNNSSFYSHATPAFFSFLIKEFPLDFLMHAAQYTALDNEMYTYYMKQFKYKDFRQDYNTLDTSGHFKKEYYTCDTSIYNKEGHFVLCTQVQDFQWKKLQNFFNKLSADKQLTYQYSFPPVEENNYKIGDEIIQRISKNAINTFDQSIWKHQYMFDMRYHLNDCGAELNAKKLLPYISKN